ncbi:hypothetical protein SAY87_030241 [Trapa incisa]|uniref:Uncharacterized protein n=1 Tax=Trapa incisa TaxID=236973 RepID=A0AAN7KRH7_9MYRT|nr:hypothetical protein SAY87_030241 [Trapa incisa]
MLDFSYTLTSVLPYSIPILFLFSLPPISLFVSLPPFQGTKTEVRPVARMNSIVLCNEFSRLDNSRLFILKGETWVLLFTDNFLWICLLNFCFCQLCSIGCSSLHYTSNCIILKKVSKNVISLFPSNYDEPGVSLE